MKLHSQKALLATVLFVMPLWVEGVYESLKKTQTTQVEGSSRNYSWIFQCQI